jgi:hypothetical protein
MDFTQELSEDPDEDKIWVSMRNPRTIPLDELSAGDVPVGPDGKPVDLEAAKLAMYAKFANLIVGWRVYDATAAEVDQNTGAPLDQPHLPMPATGALVAKLPTTIINRLIAEFKAAVNPQ